MEKNTNRKLRRSSTINSVLLLVVVGLITTFQFLFLYLSKTFNSCRLFWNNNYIYIIHVVMLFFIIIPLLLVIYYKTLNKNIRLSSVFVKPQRSAGWIFKWLLITIGVSRVFTIINFILQVLGVTSKIHITELKNDTLGMILFFASVVIIGPIGEELLFRATIFRGISEYGELFAAVVSGVMFGLWHQNIDQLFFAIVAGFILGLVFAKCRSIFVVIFIHMVNNLLATISGVSLRQIEDILHSQDTEYVIHALFVKNTLPTLLLIIVGLLSLGSAVSGSILAIREVKKNKKRFGFANPLPEYKTREKIVVFFSSPVTIITFVGMIYMLISNTEVGNWML